MKQFDLLLGYYYFRYNPYYLNIIKELAPSFRIGLLLNDEADFYGPRPAMARARETDRLYRGLCYELGAEPVLVSERASARILLMPNEIRRSYFNKPMWHFTDDYMAKLKANITYEKLFGLFFFVSPVEKSEALAGLTFDRDYAVDKDLFYDRARRLGAFDAVKDLNLHEMGAPYQAYPVFPELNGTIDYLVAFPSAVHYDRRDASLMREKLGFIKNVVRLLDQLPKDARVVIKHHNLRDKQRYFARFSLHHAGLLRAAAGWAERLAAAVPPLAQKLYSFAANCLNTLLLNTYPSLEDITPYHNFPLQVFVPAVRKGIISGYSTTAFIALSHGLPYYNCDPRSREDVANKYNEDFQVDPCHGRLVFDEAAFDRISPAFRRADFIRDLKDALGVPCIQEAQ